MRATSDQTLAVRSSHGTLLVDSEGRPVRIRLDTDDARAAQALSGITRFDLDEYRATYGEGRLDEVDILDLGYWHGGTYEPPDRVWRASFRPDAFDPIRLGM